MRENAMSVVRLAASGCVLVLATVGALHLEWRPGPEAEAAGADDLTRGRHGAHAPPAAASRFGGTPQPIVSGSPTLPQAGTFHYGDPVPVGRGVARTYVFIGDDSSREIGVALSDGVMEGLPEQGDPSGMLMPDGLSTFAFDLPLPEVNPTPYRLVVLDWNPMGHEPPGLYDLAHFDFHFYLIDSAARMAIDPDMPDFSEKAARLPDPSIVPERYFAPDVTAVPAMGVHWLDPASPELNGEVFSRTFLFGSWDGDLIFAEPMITKAYLESRPDLTFALPRAGRDHDTGPLPGSYSVRWDPDAGEYRVGLELIVR